MNGRNGRNGLAVAVAACGLAWGAGPGVETRVPVEEREATLENPDAQHSNYVYTVDLGQDAGKALVFRGSVYSWAGLTSWRITLPDGGSADVGKWVQIVNFVQSGDGLIGPYMGVSATALEADTAYYCERYGVGGTFLLIAPSNWVFLASGSSDLSGRKWSAGALP
jgi:hypothetical protein